MAVAFIVVVVVVVIVVVAMEDGREGKGMGSNI